MVVEPFVAVYMGIIRRPLRVFVRVMSIKPSFFKTKSGQPVTLGTGSGSILKDRKRTNPGDESIVNEIIDTIESSLRAGFNHIDSSEAYNTYDEVKTAIKRSGKRREDLWITTKYGGGTSTYPAKSENATKALESALDALDTDYIDLLLIHHPFFSSEHLHGETIESAWKRLEELKKSGKVREIGVSNFRIEDLERVAAVAQIAPAVNQIEFHPYLQNQSPGIVEYSQRNGILIEAYGPLTPLFRVGTTSHPLTPVLDSLAAKYDKTPAQILLRYTLQRGILPITTSSNKERQVQSVDIYNFELDPLDVALLSDEGAKFAHRGSFNGLYKDK